MQLHAVAGDLVFAAHHRPPGSLFGVGHKAQGELLSHEALHQTFRIRSELPLTGHLCRQTWNEGPPIAKTPGPEVDLTKPFRTR